MTTKTTRYRPQKPRHHHAKKNHTHTHTTTTTTTKQNPQPITHHCTTTTHHAPPTTYPPHPTHHRLTTTMPQTHHRPTMTHTEKHTHTQLLSKTQINQVNHNKSKTQTQNSLPHKSKSHYPLPLNTHIHCHHCATSQINSHHKPTPPPLTTNLDVLRHHYHTTHAVATGKTTSYWRTHAYLCHYYHHTGFWVWEEERAVVEQKQEREEKTENVLERESRWDNEERESDRYLKVRIKNYYFVLQCCYSTIVNLQCSSSPSVRWFLGFNAKFVLHIPFSSLDVNALSISLHTHMIPSLRNYIFQKFIKINNPSQNWIPN